MFECRPDGSDQTQQCKMNLETCLRLAWMGCMVDRLLVHELSPPPLVGTIDCLKHFCC